MNNKEQQVKRLSFIRLRQKSYILSIILIIGLAIPLIMGKHVNWGIDFAGGIKMQAKFPIAVERDKINQAISEMNLNAVVQSVGEREKNEYIVSMGILSNAMQKDIASLYAPEDEKSEIITKIDNGLPVDIIRFLKIGIEKKVIEKAGLKGLSNKDQIVWQNAESVGPAVGSMLRRDGLKLFLVASFFMIMYLTFRFEFRYSVAAMVALLHDLLIIALYIGIMGIEVNIPVLAALLTLLGYSINDTIVIFDRIRENSQVKTNIPFVETIDESIWQSMTRSLMTSFTTIVAVGAILVFGGEALSGFAQTLLFGLVLGTYSSVFIAAPVLYEWDRYFASRTIKKPIESTYNVS